MGTMTINVTPHMEQLIKEWVSSGEYKSETELIYDAIRVWCQQNGKHDPFADEEVEQNENQVSNN